MVRRLRVDRTPEQKLEIVSRGLSNRRRTEGALAAVEGAVLERLPTGSREAGLTLTTDYGTQFISTRFLDRSAQLGGRTSISSSWRAWSVKRSKG